MAIARNQEVAVPALPPAVWGYVALTTLFVVTWFVTYRRLSQRRDDAVDLATQVLAQAILLRLASVEHFAEHEQSLRQMFGVSDWHLYLAVQQLRDQSKVRVREDHDGSLWVQLTAAPQS
jgi:hypothetical protein